MEEFDQPAQGPVARASGAGPAPGPVPAAVRSRRPRHRVAPGAAVALLLAAGGWWVHDALAGRPEPATPQAVPSSGGSDPCAGLAKGTGPDDRAVTLATGAVGVRLCGSSDDPAMVGSVPRDELVTAPDSLVARYNGLPAIRGERVCSAVGGPGYRMAFRYADGTVAVVRGDLGGCSDVGGREGADKLSAAFVAALQQQRRTRPAPTVTVAHPCAGPQWSWVPADRQALVAGEWCDSLADGSRHTMPAELVELVATDMAGMAGTAGGRMPDAGHTAVLVDRHGQPVVFQWQDDRGWVMGGTRSFTLSRATAAGLREMVTSVGGARARTLCGQAAAPGVLGDVVSGARCDGTPRMVPDDAAGSLAKMLADDGIPGKALTGGVRVVLADGSGHRVAVTWQGAAASWTDPVKHRTTRLAVPDWLRQRLTAS